MTSANLGKNLCPFFGAACLKCNENAVFLFKNTSNEEKLSFLFETTILY